MEPDLFCLVCFKVHEILVERIVKPCLSGPVWLGPCFSHTACKLSDLCLLSSVNAARTSCNTSTLSFASLTRWFLCFTLPPLKSAVWVRCPCFLFPWHLVPHGNQISSLRCHLFVCVLHQDVNSRRTGTWSVTYTVVPFSQLQLHVIGNWLNKHFADAPLQCVIIHKYQLSFYSCQIHLTFFPTKSMHPWNYCSHGFHLETFEMLQITSSGTPFQKTHASQQRTDLY